jgi:DNA-binding winged helix-turn-helix (wHTH) protein
MSAEGKVLYEFGNFRCDPREHLLLCDGKPLSLSPKSFEILVTLIRNNGRLLTKDELMQQVWPDSFVEEANLTVNISALRKVLGETPGGLQYIETVPKWGYRFVAPVRECRDDGKLSPPTQAPSVAQVEPLPGVVPAPISRPRTRRWWPVAAVALVAATVGVLV